MIGTKKRMMVGARPLPLAPVGERSRADHGLYLATSAFHRWPQFATFASKGGFPRKLLDGIVPRVTVSK